MEKTTRILCLAFLSSLSAGCASVMEGSDHVININTTGCEDSGIKICTVMNSKGSSVITAPASTSVEKTRGALTITCLSRDKSASGSLIVDSNYEAMNAGNLLLGGIIGLGVDAATGAMWKYPRAVVVPMKCPID
mgnify:FL=1|jgi:hypothetical protein